MYSADGGIAAALRGLVQAIGGRCQQQVRTLGQGHHEQRDTADVEAGVGVADGVG